MIGKKQLVSTGTAPADGGRSAARFPFPCFTKPAKSLVALVAAGLVFGLSPQAAAVPPGPPTAPTENRVFAVCTFNIGLLRTALTIDSSAFVGEVVEANTIVLYVRENPNGGQKFLSPPATFTGPVLCINEATDVIVQTTESEAIPPTGSGAVSLDITGAEELFWLQYEVNGATSDPPDGDIENRFCLSVRDRTDCFLGSPSP